MLLGLLVLSDLSSLFLFIFPFYFLLLPDYLLTFIWNLPYARSCGKYIVLHCPVAFSKSPASWRLLVLTLFMSFYNDLMGQIILSSLWKARDHIRQKCSMQGGVFISHAWQSQLQLHSGNHCACAWLMSGVLRLALAHTNHPVSLGGTK